MGGGHLTLGRRSPKRGVVCLWCVFALGIAVALDGVELKAAASPIQSLQEENASLRAALEQARTEITLLRQKLDALARREFFEAQEQAPSVAGWILNQIGILYRWEEQLRRSRAGPGGQEALRASHSRMVMLDFNRLA